MRRLALAACAWATLLGTAAAAEPWRPSGAVSALVLVDTEDGGLGGSVFVDVWQPFGVFQLGFGAGLAAVASDNPNASAIVTPAGVVVGIGSVPRPVGVRAFVRAGGWGGATNSGLRGGALLSGGVALDVRLDDVLALGVGVEAWRLWGKLDRFLVAPTLSLVWRL